MPNAPATEPFPVLIHGGSTATGVIGIQLAKASNLQVIATASPSNFEYLKSLGADAVFDYRSPTAAADIRAYTNNALKHAWDCAGNGEAICGGALSSTEPSHYAAINRPEEENIDTLKKVNPLVGEPIFTLGYTCFGEDFVKAETEFKGNPEEREQNSKFMDIVQELLEQGKVVPIKTILNNPEPGLEGAIKGLDLLRNKKVSGSKLVYTL